MIKLLLAIISLAILLIGAWSKANADKAKRQEELRKKRDEAIVSDDPSLITGVFDKLRR